MRVAEAAWKQKCGNHDLLHRRLLLGSTTVVIKQRQHKELAIIGKIGFTLNTSAEKYRPCRWEGKRS